MLEIVLLVSPRQGTCGHGFPTATVQIGADFIDDGLKFRVGKEVLNNHITLILKLPNLAVFEPKL